MSKALTAALLGCFLAGCGNAYERLYMGEWKPAGEATTPGERGAELSPEAFRVTTLDPGQGREIKAGSLAEIRIVAKSGLLQDAATFEPLPNAKAWLWVGNANTAGERRVGNLGPPQLRAALGGFRQGARFSVFVDRKKVGLILSLPIRGFLLPFSYKPNWRQAGDTAGSLDKEYAELVQTGDYEVEVLRVCDGRLFRKQALLKQWGYVLGWGEFHREFARQGVLEWLAIEADCGADEKIRLEKGPAYGIGSPGYRENTLLMWQESYEEATRKNRISKLSEPYAR